MTLFHRQTILCQITVGSLVYQIINDLLCGIYTFFVLDIRSGRTYKHVAVNGRSGKNTFTHRTRQREDGCVEVVTQLFIHQQILAFTGNDLHLLFTYHVMHNVRINAGCIDNNLCFQRTFVGIQLVIAIFFTIFSTFVSNLNSTPFTAAFSPMAIARLNGQMIPPVGT